MRKAGFDASALFLIVIAVLLAGGVVFTVSTMRQDPLKDTLTGDRVINTLFVIENGDSSNVKPLCTYLLMYYPATRRAAVFDIPGSLGLIIQRIDRVDRIDTVYDPRRIAPYAGEIEKVLGLEISFSVVFTLENLGKVTDLIEGVELFIPNSIDERLDEHVLFSSGLSRLDGDKAKVYISYELSEESDELAGFRRQRFFIGLIKRLGEQNNYLKNPQVARVFQSLARVGINTRGQAGLFDALAGIDTDRVSFQSVGGNVREVSGQALIFPYWDGSLIKDIVRQTSAGLVRPAESTLGDRVFTVEVLNGTVVSGLAGRTAELFQNFGYDIIAIGNADRNDYETTIIIDRSGSEEMVRAFGDVIRCSNIRYDIPNYAQEGIELILQDYEYQPDITLILGNDFNGRYVTR